MNPATIDVNVHPAKLEVKFADESKVFDVVYHAIRSALEKNNRETSPFTIVREEKQIEQISKDLINNGVIPKEEKRFDFNAAPKIAKPVETKTVNSNDLIASLNEKIGNIKEEVLYRKLEVQTNEFMKKYDINELPSLLFFRDGKILGKVEGYYDETQKEKLIEKICAIIGEVNK